MSVTTSSIPRLPRLIAVAAAAGALATCVVGGAPATADVSRTIYLAPSGNDGADGSPGAPVASLGRAQELVRKALASGSGPVTVELADGTYHLSDTLSLTAADSGTASAPVIWRAADGATPVLSGGRVVDANWQQYKGNIVVTDLPANVDTEQLFVDGKRQVLARYPNFTPGARLDGFAADAIAKSRTDRWADPTTAQVRGLHGSEWGGNSFSVTGRNSDGTVKLQWVGDNQRGSTLHSTYRMVENVFEELDAPGEWFHDRKAGKLYYWPAPGVDPHTATFTTAELTELVRVEGESASAPAHDIEFEGVTFTGTDRTLFSETFEPISLSDWAIVRKGAFVMHNTERVDVRGSHFDQVGGNALFIDGYASGNVVDDNEFTASGASDVAVVGRKEAVRDYSTWGKEVRTPSDLTPGPKSEDYPRDVTISNNLMTQMGRFEKQTAGVEISIAQGVKVLRNTIHDGPRAGINIGDGTWGGHLIQGNDIYNMVRETGDHGPINAWGRDRFWPATGLTDSQRKSMAFLDAMTPTRIDHNRIWHDHEWAIDLDDGSGNYVLTNNLLLNAGIKFREGYGRTAENNIIVDGGIHSHVSYPSNGDVVQRNVTFGQTPYYLIQVRSASQFATYDNNVFYNNGRAVDVVNDAWRTAGRDVNSVIADPQTSKNPWTNPTMLDYSFAPDSPALARGFVNFSMSEFGRPGYVPTIPAVSWNAAPVVESRGSLVEPWLGATLSGIDAIDLASSVGLPVDSGVYLKNVPAGSTAAAAGLTNADVIRSVNGTAITTKNSFWKAWNLLPAGTPVKLDVWRNQSATTILVTRPAGVEKINNTSGVDYTGPGWDWKSATRGGTGAYLNDIDATNKTGTAFTLTFWGSRLTMSTQKNSDETQLEIRIDGGAWQRVDLTNGSRIHQSQVFDSGALEAKPHTVEARNVGADGRWFIVDSFEITR